MSPGEFVYFFRGVFSRFLGVILQKLRHIIKGKRASDVGLVIPGRPILTLRARVGRIFHWLALGTLGVALCRSGVALGTQGFLDTNILFSHWGSRPMRGPNKKGFALGWHLGYRIY